MKYYVIVETNVSDPSWVPEYTEKVTPMVHKYGGRYLTRTPDVELIEGEGGVPEFSVIVEFPSKQAALDLFASEEYAPFKKARLAGSTSRMMIVSENEPS